VLVSQSFIKERPMRIASLVIATALVGGAAMSGGCDDTIEHRESKEVKNDGTVVEKEKTVKEKPDGTIVKEESQSKTNP
jgi:hypothetical protein